MTAMTMMGRRLAILGTLGVILAASGGEAPRRMEYLDRGTVAVRRGETEVFVSWRLRADDPEGVRFDVYRQTGDALPAKLNPEPLAGPTCLVDPGADPAQANVYTVRVAGREAAEDASAPFVLAADSPADAFLTIPLQTPEGYTPNDASVGDLDGDGRYEIVLHQAGRGRDNSQRGMTDPPILEAYRIDGTFLWRINLGRNIREGAHYTQFMVYDLDGDGRAEVACKTADGTTDGEGAVIGDPDADHRNPGGYILGGPEFLTVFDGETGGALATVPFIPPRAPDLYPSPQQIKAIWGDDYGNRLDRFLACIAYLDGERPSLVMCRGYYTRVCLTAWNWRDGALTRVWSFDSDDGTPGNEAYRGQGNHSVAAGDIDGDGRDEIVYGACAVDDDGKGLYTTGLGHGDALHLSDIDPERPGLEVWGIHEKPRHDHAANLRDAATGRVLWSLKSEDVGRGVTMDIDPRYPGYECWAGGRGLRGLYSCKGEKISDTTPRSCNMGIWWDGDLLREILDGVSVSKWDPATEATNPVFSAPGCARNNGTKANPCLAADILGDWREELVARTEDGKELRIFTTAIPTAHRLTTLMHDPIYRLAIAWQNVGYNQPAHPGFYLGEGMTPPPRPNIVTVRRGER